MAAAYKVFTVDIPSDNGYKENPDAVVQRVIPHIKNIEPYAEMEPLGEGKWTLTTPHLGSPIVIGILSRHYGFETVETGSVVK